MAARSLAAGDPLGALKRVALREDPPALALRGIGMAQLGEYERARKLLRRAARGFGVSERLAQARCQVAEAEVALAPSILCLEDVDSLLTRDGSLSHFLNRLDGLAPLEGVLILATTNHPEDLDEATRICVAHRFHFWDALLWATAKRAGCRAILTEDRPGLVELEGVRFIDPFRPEDGELLDLVLPKA